MGPALSPGDTVLVSRWSYGPYLPWNQASRVWLRIPEAGEVVVIVDAVGGAAAVKRIMAAPGAPVRVAHGRLIAGDLQAVLTERQYEQLRGIQNLPKGLWRTKIV